MGTTIMNTTISEEMVLIRLSTRTANTSLNIASKDLLNWFSVEDTEGLHRKVLDLNVSLYEGRHVNQGRQKLLNSKYLKGSFSPEAGGYLIPMSDLESFLQMAKEVEAEVEEENSIAVTKRENLRKAAYADLIQVIEQNGYSEEIAVKIADRAIARFPSESALRNQTVVIMATKLDFEGESSESSETEDSPLASEAFRVARETQQKEAYRMGLVYRMSPVFENLVKLRIAHMSDRGVTPKPRNDYMEALKDFQLAPIAQNRDMQDFLAIAGQAIESSTVADDLVAGWVYYYAHNDLLDKVPEKVKNLYTSDDIEEIAADPEFSFAELRATHGVATA